MTEQNLGKAQMMICDKCGRDLKALGHQNTTFVQGAVICEDCHQDLMTELRLLFDRISETLDWSDEE